MVFDDGRQRSLMVLNSHSVFTHKSNRPQILPTIVVMGAESTGKTTLAKALAAEYNTVWIEEYLRLFVDSKGDVPVESDVHVIAKGHLDLVVKQSQNAHRLMFLDTDLFTTCVYQRIYFGVCPKSIERAAERHQSGLYLFTEPDIAWVPDPGQRSGPKQRLHSHKLLHEESKKYGLRTVNIQGTHEDRLKTSIQAVDQYISDLQ